MKQQRLMDVMNDLDDVLIENAAPSGKKRGRRMWARLGAAAACFLLGFCASFLLFPLLDVQANDIPYTDSVPEIILAEDLDAVFEVIELHPDASEHEVRRLHAFFERLELTETMPDKHRQAVIRQYPIAEYAAIYILEPTITDLERSWVDVALQLYGGYTVDRKAADAEHINRVARENGLEPLAD